MVSIFNRKELLTTFKMDEQARARDLLAANDIDYTVKTVDRTSPSPVSAGSRARAGTFGVAGEAAYQYIIYVRAADYEKALQVIAK